VNTFGRIFRVHIFGESHGQCTGVCIDGCPAGISIDEADFTTDLNRRRAGAFGTTTRTEEDIPTIVTGSFNGYTTGAPITILFKNKNINETDYKNKNIPRPGHADFAANTKYRGYNDFRGGGHFSGRITVGLVAAGVIAKKIISSIKITASIYKIGGEKENWDRIIEKTARSRNSVGGVVMCCVEGLKSGIGEPFFDSVESTISHLIFSIPAIRGIEFGQGFLAADVTGLEHNDPFVSTCGRTSSNNAGGINGGITNSNPIVYFVAVKPTSSIQYPQLTMNMETHEMESLTTEGRHDVCIALRMPPIVEAVTAIALTDLMMVSGEIGGQVNGWTSKHVNNKP
jgi:chorismate synthase